MRILWKQAHLLIFHMYLRCRRLSTYEYILEGRRKREEEEEAKEEEAITQGQVGFSFFRSFFFVLLFLVFVARLFAVVSFAQPRIWTTKHI